MKTKMNYLRVILMVMVGVLMMGVNPVLAQGNRSNNNGNGRGVRNNCSLRANATDAQIYELDKLREAHRSSRQEMRNECRQTNGTGGNADFREKREVQRLNHRKEVAKVLGVSVEELGTGTRRNCSGNRMNNSRNNNRNNRGNRK